MHLLFDVGGTKTRVAVSRDGRRFLEPRVFPTPQGFREAVLAFRRVGQELAPRGIRAVVGGVPGPFTKDKTAIAHSYNLPQWAKKPLKRSLERTLGVPVHLFHDAALAGLGEAVYGAGKGADIVAYLTVSTGVGGARIVNGSVDANAFGFEPGEQKILTTSDVVTLEDLVSGSAFQKRYGKPAYEVRDARAWEDAARLLAHGAYNAIVHWSPDVFVLGGPMITGSPAISLPRVRYHLRRLNRVYPALPPLLKAKLGDHGGLYGALVIARSLEV